MPTKENVVIENTKDIYQELQAVRFELSQSDLHKSGRNKHLNFQYFELKDFLPTATKLLNEHGLTPVFRIEIDPAGIEYAFLTIIKGNEQIIFKAPTAEPQASNNPIQMLGSKITYMRRYMFMIALDVIEDDSVDNDKEESQGGNAVDLATPGQIAVIKANTKLIVDLLKEKGIQDTTALASISKQEASVLVSTIKERQKANGQG